MPKRFRLTRRMTIGMTEDAHRKLRDLSRAAGLMEEEFISFVFENWDGITDEARLLHRLRLFNADIDDRKR